jgi:hypothetical protein
MDVEPGPVMVLSSLVLSLIVLGVACAVIVVIRFNTPQRFRCPFLRCDVAVTFEEWGGRRQDVVRCSAFGRGEQIDCGKRCLETEDLPVTTAGGGIRWGT